MISKLNEKALIKADQTAFRKALIRKVNQLVDAVNVGVVHDNKVQADRNIVTAQQAITEQDLMNIENGIATTELELMLLEMGVENE